MAFALRQNHSVAVNRETTWGTPVTTGALYLAMSNAQLQSRLQTIESTVINPDHRETVDLIDVASDGGGTVNGELIYDPAWEMCLESLFAKALTGTTTRVFKVGKTLMPLTLQERWSDITQFVSYPGAIAQSLSLNVVSKQQMTWNFGFSSKEGVLATSTAIGTVGAQTSNDVMRPRTSIQLMNVNASSVLGLASFSLNITNELIEIPDLLTAEPAALLVGGIKVTGSVTVAKKDAVLAARFLAQQDNAFAVTLGGASSKNYAFSLPLAKFTGSQPGEQNNWSKTETFPFTARYDASSTSSITVTATD